MAKKRLIYIGLSILYAAGFGLLTLTVYDFLARSNILLATLLNLLLILLFIIEEKFERVVLEKLIALEKKQGLNPFFKFIKFYILGPSFKSALYLFYIVILAGVAALAANPDIAFLQPLSGYLTSVQYGILFLIAVDKFLINIIKDIKKDEKCTTLATQQIDIVDDTIEVAKDVTQEKTKEVINENIVE